MTSDAVERESGRQSKTKIFISYSRHDSEFARRLYDALRQRCDAVVVGSAIVRAIADGDSAGAPARAAAVVRRILDKQPAAS